MQIVIINNPHLPIGLFQTTIDSEAEIKISY